MKDKIIKHLQEPVKLVEDTDYATYALKLDDNRVVEFVCTDNWLTINHAKLKDNEYLVLPSNEELSFWLFGMLKDIDSNCKNINLVVPDFYGFPQPVYNMTLMDLHAKSYKAAKNSECYHGQPVNINLILPKESKMFYSVTADTDNFQSYNLVKMDRFDSKNYSTIGIYSKCVGICSNQMFKDIEGIPLEIGGFTWNNVTVSVDKTKYYHDGVIYEYGDKKDKGRPLSEILEEKMFN